MKNRNIPSSMLLAFNVQLRRLSNSNAHAAAQRIDLLENMTQIALKGVFASMEKGSPPDLPKEEAKKYVDLLGEFGELVSPTNQVLFAKSFIAEQIMDDMFSAYTVNGLTEGVVAHLKREHIGYDLLSEIDDNALWKQCLPPRVALYSTWEISKDGYLAFSVYDVEYKTDEEFNEAQKHSTIENLPKQAIHALQFELVEAGDPSMGKLEGAASEGFIGFRLKLDVDQGQHTRKAIAEIAQICSIVLTPDSQMTENLGVGFTAARQFMDKQGNVVATEAFDPNKDKLGIPVNDNNPYPTVKPVEAPPPRPDSIKFDSADAFLNSVFGKKDKPASE